MMKRFKCGYCRKVVRDKPILGTMHVCVSSGERVMIDYYRWCATEQKRLNDQWERYRLACEGS